ncbi:hypothetical protein BIV25_30260 [Streptomyces sp. MUSC 14]|uniref:serine/threonine-protein kinase n=1 Tax=Streptomyces sp. MUSC 14 TaxID=1354889 RepID=UPI0008F5D300|nr:serine/threonine-protein kinase [Streptomyces sp. MUSC 14]OIJ91021.1 hypothetical protein BIV25_30260 [Streptomyces sp. MUSC 14]
MKPLGTGDPLRLGPYRVLGVLGEGGMGKVYVGRDGAGSLAAVKVLRPELVHDTNLTQRFVREAQAAQAVRSNGIANVLGAWTEGGRPWIASEFLAGLTLDQAVDTYGPLDEPALRALATALARTLADIHAAGFVHRDLKPPNIVLTSAGPRIIDFGIARPEHGLTLTTTGQVPVTPGYGAPEQVLGQRVAPSADVFSLGAVLVYAATGRRAYEGSHVAAVQYAVVHEEPRLDGIDPEIRALITPCLAKDAAARPAPPQIVQAMAVPKGADRVWRRGPVAEAIREREAGARRLTAPVTIETAPSVTRRRLLTGLAAGGVVLAGGGGTAAWWFGRRGGSTKSGPFDIPPAVPAPVQKLDKGVKDFSDDDVRPTFLWQVHGEADAYSQTLLPAGDVIVFGIATGGIAGFDVINGKRRWSATHLRAKSGYLSLSDRLVVGVDGKGALQTFVPSTGEPKWTCPAAEAAVLLAVDDEALYLVTTDHRLRSVNRSDARIRWTAAVPTRFRGHLLAPAVAAQGRLVITAGDGTVLVVHTSDGSTAWTRLDQDEDRTVSPAVHDDMVYINGKSVDARRLSDGTRIWNTKLNVYEDDGNNYGWGPAAVYADAVYTNVIDGTRCLDRDSGKVRWEAFQNANYDSPVVRQGQGVWTLGSASNGYGPQLLINAVRASDGKSSRKCMVPSPDYTRLAAASNRVFVMYDSSVVALSTF